MSLSGFPIELLTLVGGVQLVLFGLAGFLLKVWTARIIEREKARLTGALKEEELRRQKQLQESLQESKSMLGGRYARKH